MYEIAKKARAGMKSKAERLAGEKDRKTDSSDWSPAPQLNADVKTGMRPVSRQARKSGGKVMGCAPTARADRKPRKAGGRVEEKGEQPIVDRYVNRDLKKANEYRDGKKHDGGLKRGGRAAKASGGSMSMEEMIKKNPAPAKKPLGLDKVPVPTPRPANLTPAANNKIKPDQSKYLTGDDITGPPAIRKDGGRAKKADGGPMMQDPRLGIVKPKTMEFGQNVVTPGLKNGGRMAKASGGSAEFKAAFRAARNAFLSGEGPKNFEFKGKSYSTNLASDYKPTTGPSTRGGTSGAPRREKIIDVQFGPVNTDSAGKQVYTPPRVMGTGQGVSTTARPSITPAAAPRSQTQGMPDTDAMGNPTGGGMKKGGRIKKFGGGALGMSANRMMPLLPPQAMANAQGVPMQNGSFMPPGLANRPAMPTLPPQAMAAAAPTPMPMPMARASGGRTKAKGKTNINIVIATGAKPKSMIPDVNQAPMGPQAVPMVAPPAAAPMGAGAPPSAPMGGGQPPMPPMPMPRKAGGRVSKVARSFKDMTAGSGSGEGRLQKTDIAKSRSPRKAGGKVYRSYKDMDAGAGSGEGRLEKTEIQSRKR